MALSTTVVTKDSFLVHGDTDETRERAEQLTFASLCYIGVVNRARELVTRRRHRPPLDRTSLRAYAERHIVSPINERALNGLRYFPAVEATLGGVAAGQRVGRRTLTGANASLFLDDGAVRSAQRDAPIVNIYVREPCTQSTVLYETDARALLVPLAAETLYGATETSRSTLTPIGLPLDDDDNAMDAAARQSRPAGPSFAMTRQAAKYMLVRNEQQPQQQVRQQSRKRARSQSDGNNAVGNNAVDSVPAVQRSRVANNDDGGESLGDSDTDDDDDDDDADEDTYNDGFVVSDGEDDDDEDEDEDEEDDEDEDEDEEDDDDDDDDDEQRLVDVNAVEAFDGRCQLHETGSIELADGTTVEASHTYVLDGRLGPESATTVLSTYFDHFDAVRVSTNMVASRNWPAKLEYYAPATEAAETSLRARWREVWAPHVAEWTAEDARRAADAFAAGDARFASLLAVTDAPDACADEKLVRTMTALREAATDAAAAHIRAMWTSYADLGTEMHERIETFLDASAAADAIVAQHARARLDSLAPSHAELRQFLRWYDTWLVPRGYVPFRVELRVFDEALRIAGSIDALFRHRETGEIIMVDWKRSKGIARHGFERVALDGDAADANGCLFEWRDADMPPFAKACLPPVAELLSCNYNKYWLQQLLYKYMIEKNSELRLSGMYLVVCHPRQGERYDLMPLEANDELIGRIVADRLALVRRRDAEDAEDDDFTAPAVVPSSERKPICGHLIPWRDDDAVARHRADNGQCCQCATHLRDGHCPDCCDLTTLLT